MAHLCIVETIRIPGIGAFTVGA